MTGWFGTLWKSFATGALLSVAVGTTALAQEACTPRHEGLQTLEEGFITAAVLILPPVAFVDASGAVTGIDGDILHEIAKMECLEVKALTVDQAAAIQAVISKRADLTMGGWFRTAARAEVVNLSEPLYLQQMSVWSSEGIDTIADLEGKKVGTVQGTLWAKDAKTIFGDDLTLYANSVGMQQDLMSGRIDAAFNSLAAGLGAKFAGGLEGIKVEVAKADPRIKASEIPSQSSFPVSKENASLLQALDDDIKELRANGTIAKILEKYGMPVSAADTGEARLIK